MTTTAIIEKLSIPSRSYFSLNQVYGADFGRHNNIHVLDNDTIVYAIGNAVRIHNVTTGSMRYIYGRDGAGVGAVAVHPSRSHIAIAERNYVGGPNIYIYTYPSLELTNVLVGGTERGYTDINFSVRNGGLNLVSVGSFPDFLLAVWEWSTGRLILRTKAFGQEVFNARFSPDDEGRLTTSGTGHIRFWRMASTFTGLKLQGAIGKFGRVDLSDIHAFAELPDGKVVSGCESGWLLLWDGGAIKTQIGRRDAEENHQNLKLEDTGATNSAHDAPIHVVQFDRLLGTFITGGDDGTIRFWDWKHVDNADTLPDGISIPGIVPITEYNLGERVRIRGIAKLSEQSVENSDERIINWLVQDRQGNLYRLTTKVTGTKGLTITNKENPASSIGITSNVTVTECINLYQGHGGSITGLVSSPVASEPYAASIGSDGSVRCWDTNNHSLVLSTRFSLTLRPNNNESEEDFRPNAANNDQHQLRGTCISWAPISVDPLGRTIATGFSDGTVRILYRGTNEWKRLQTLKPASTPITTLTYSPDGKLLIVTAHDGTVFFIQIVPKTGGSSLEADNAPETIKALVHKQYLPLGFITITNNMNTNDEPSSPSKSGNTNNNHDNTDTKGIPINCCAITNDNRQIVFGCNDSTFHIITLPTEGTTYPDTSKSFDLSSSGIFLIQSLRFDLEIKKAAPPPPPPAVEKEGTKKKKDEPEAPPIEWPTEVVEPGKPGEITAISFVSNTKLLLGCSGDGSHLLHEITLPKTAKYGSTKPIRPSACFPITPLYSGENVRRPYITSLQSSNESLGLLFVTTSAGSIYIRSLASPGVMTRLQLGDVENGGLTNCTFIAANNKLLVSGGDGAITSLSLLHDNLQQTLVAAVPEYTVTYIVGYAPIDIRLAVPVGPILTAASTDTNTSSANATNQEEKKSEGDAPADASSASSAEANEAERARKDAAAAAAALSAAQGSVAYLPTIPSTEIIPVAADQLVVPGDKSADEWLTTHAAADITDPTTYSIQEDRLKSAEDARRRDAEQEKAKVRTVIANLRSAYAQLRTRATQENTIHPARGLTEQELDLDPELSALLRAEGEEKLQEVDRECAYERARRRVALSKLIKAFLADLIYDTESVSGIARRDIIVHTLRTTALPPELADSIATAEMESSHTSRPGSATGRKGTGNQLDSTPEKISSRAGSASRNPNAITNSLSNSGKKNDNTPIAESAEEISFEFRKDLRNNRRIALKALEGKRPGANDEDANDVQAVLYAKDHMGDYRLKTDKAYKVPEGVKLDHISKRRQTLLLEGYIYRERMRFNSQVIALRERKRAIVQALREAESEILAIDTELSKGPTAHILNAAHEDIHPLLPAKLLQNPINTFSLPNLDNVIAPEEQQGWESLTTLAARHISDALAERQWDAHVRSYRQSSTNSANVTSTSVFNSYGGVMSNFLTRLYQVKTTSSNGDSDASTTITSFASTDNLLTVRNYIIAQNSPDAQGLMLRAWNPSEYSFSVAEMHYAPIAPIANLWSQLPANFTSHSMPSPEAVDAAVTAVRALGDRKLLLRSRQIALLEGFDAAVAALRRERLEVTTNCVAGNLRLSILRQELALLTDMAKRDAALEARLAKAKADKAGIATAIAQYSAQIAEKKLETDAFTTKERALLSEFDESIGSSHPAYAALLKIYKRKIKRAKATPAGGNAEEEEEEDDLDDLDDIGDDDDDDEEETCPDNCSKETYERVLAMRNRRLDVTDAVDDINKAIDEIRKASDRQSQRERQVDRDLTSINNEIVVFQREKQGKLNIIDTWVVLKSSQLLAGKQPLPTTPVAPDAPEVIDDGKPIGLLPSTIDHCVLFTRAALRRLRSRIGELDHENSDLVLAQKELQKEEKLLAMEKKRLETEIAGVRAQCEEIQILKFGKVIDVEALDRATGATATSLAAVAAEQDKAEAEAAKEMELAKKRLAILQDRLTELTRSHTAALENIATLQARVAALEGELSGKSHSGLTAVALHATLGTGLATAVANGKINAHSLAALQPVLAKGAQAKRLAGNAAQDPKNATSNVTLGLTLNGGKGGISSTDESVAERQEAAERARLMELVSRQATLLEAMKAEAAMLKSKSGPAYVTPAELTVYLQQTSQQQQPGPDKTQAVQPPRAPSGLGQLTLTGTNKTNLGNTTGTFAGPGVTVGAMNMKNKPSTAPTKPVSTVTKK